MVRWVGALLTAAVLSGFAFLLLTGDYIREGPVLVTLSESHGIHRGDVGIVAFWHARRDGGIGHGGSVP